MLALETGWTERSLDRLSSTFRAACHWALYVRSIVGVDGIDQPDLPSGASADDRLAVMRQSAALMKLRSNLYPEDDDGL